MPRVQAAEVKKERTPKQLANDERLRNLAKNRPVRRRQSVEASDQKVGQDGVREFDANSDLPQVKVEPPGRHSAKWKEDMAFANEMVRVVVHEDTNERAHPFPEVTVNGRTQRFVRGEEQMVRRCYVEKLARMKLTAYGNVKTKDVDGEDVYRYPQRTGLVYPFAVIDDSEKGKAWLKRILAEA
jgi:hypothetical protein